jgi:arylsulfatase A-like enzyme
MKLFLSAFFCIVFYGSAYADDQNLRANIVLMYVDDLGYGDLGVYGHPVIETPNIDKLAAEGIKLTAFYAPSPLCSPSRAALLTGRTPYRTGIQSWIPQNTDAYLSEKEITIAASLKEHGYQTAIVGKWHLNGGLDREDQAQPADHGFDHSYVLHAFPLPHQNNPTNFYANGEPLGEVKGFTAEIVVNESKKWLDGRDQSAPFFLYMPFIEPHATIHSPDKFLEKYADYTSGKPVPVVNGQPSYPESIEARGPGEYYANISHLDNQVGRFLEYLEASGLADNTIVLFLSDNGPVTIDWRAWWEVNLYGDTGGYRGRKADLYEGGIRVPGIIRYPALIEAGMVSNEAINGYDIFPTLASILNIPTPSDRAIDGIDVSPIFKGEELSREKPLFWAFPAAKGAPNYVVQKGDWKLLAGRDRKPMALYNLGSDRFELNNVADSHPDIVRALYGEMLSYINDVRDDPLRPAWAVDWDYKN